MEYIQCTQRERENSQVRPGKREKEERKKIQISSISSPLALLCLVMVVVVLGSDFRYAAANRIFTCAIEGPDHKVKDFWVSAMFI